MGGEGEGGVQNNLEELPVGHFVFVFFFPFTNLLCFVASSHSPAVRSSSATVRAMRLYVQGRAFLYIVTQLMFLFSYRSIWNVSR